jgi:hypothetical protein
MKITYSGADVLICDIDDNGKSAFIACTEIAESKLYNWQIQIMNKTGAGIGHVRTVFGLTFYSHNKEQKELIKNFIKESELTIWYGHL